MTEEGNTLKIRVIPSLLLRNGRLVKGRRFIDHLDAGNPTTTARAHNAQGADELMLLDIDASKEKRGPNLDGIARVAEECFMPLAAGGGIRTLDDVKAVIDAGADKIVINTGALDRPAILSEAAALYGAQAVVIAVDVSGSPPQRAVYDHRSSSRTSLSPERWVRECVERGAGEVRLCSVDREGMREGFDVELVASIRKEIRAPIIIEGGAGSLPHIAEAVNAGADAVALGSLLIFSDNNIVKVRRYLSGAGYPVRI